jgi:hypothetical protein
MTVCIPDELYKKLMFNLNEHAEKEIDHGKFMQKMIKKIKAEVKKKNTCDINKLQTM